MHILGMDIGTTSVKVCIYDSVTNEILAKRNKDTAASIPSDQGIEGNKQDVPKIVSAIHECVSRLPRDLLKSVVKIGICGQMHGVVMWNNRETRAWKKVKKENILMRYEAVREEVSALYTWQDSRCKPEFLDTLPKPDSHLKCNSGYGCATLLWLAKYKPDKLKNYSCAGTIQDFVVAMICDLQRPLMSDQNAASWGYFNTETNEWNRDILKSVNFVDDFLPQVVKSGQIAGKLNETWMGIPADTPVGAAFGDLQCSTLATIQNNEDAVLNISTSAQLGFISNSILTHESNTVEYLPYFDSKYLAVAASLNGGNALATFVKMLQQWTQELGFNVPQSKVWERLIALGLEANDKSQMQIEPLLFGERHAPNSRASVSNIDLSNLSLGQVFRSLCEGVIENLHKMIPKEFLIESGIKRIVGNGSGLSRNIVFQRAVQSVYKLPLEFTSGGDAARGAAIAALTI